MSSDPSIDPTAFLPLQKPGGGLDLLRGVKVLDLTTSVAGPYAGQLLADLGADVVKIERLEGGDDARAWGPPFFDEQSMWFLAVNRNKRSVSLDHASAEGTDLLHRLARQADVVLVNQLERVQHKLHIDYDSLSAARPDLIHVSITGFGLEGPRKNMPCYDLIAEGYSGIMDLTGEADGAPQKVGTPAADLLAGQDAAMAVLAALYRRQRDGLGCKVDVALVDSMTRFMAPRIMSFLGSGEVPTRSGGRDSVIAIYQTFETADEPITLGLGNDRIWSKFWACVEDEDYGRDLRFATNALRRRHRAEIVDRIQTILRLRPRDDWLLLLAAGGIPAGPIYTVDQVCKDAQLLQRGLFYTVEGSSDKPLPQVGLGIKFDGTSASFRSAPPRLGQHTDEVQADWLGARQEGS